MAIIVTTPEPHRLVDSLKAEIKKGAARTWIHERYAKPPNKDFFTHSGEDNRFYHLAWFTPEVLQGQVVFRLFSPGGSAVEYGLWGVYHGRFVELILNHGCVSISAVRVTADAFDGDVKRKAPPKVERPEKPVPKGKGSSSGMKLDDLLKRLKEL